MDKKKDDFPDYHVWDLKKAISEFIVPRLIQYIKMVETGQIVCIPNWVQSNPDASKIDEVELMRIWSDILKEILIPFDYQINPEKYDSFSRIELEQRRKKGLALFARYFDHLWD